MNMKWTMKHNKIHMKHKRHTCYSHNHMNLMKQSSCLSLILYKDIQCRKKVSFPQSPRSYQPTNSSLFLLFYTSTCICPFISTHSLAPWLPPHSTFWLPFSICFSFLCTRINQCFTNTFKRKRGGITIEMMLIEKNIRDVHESWTVICL